MTRLAMPALAVLLVWLGASGHARAQRTLAQDTLSEGTPVAASCGFCAADRFGVVFRELDPPMRGLDPADFPLTLRRLQVGVAAIQISAGMCQGLDAAAPVETVVEIYAGTMPPAGVIRSMPADVEWPGETLVWATDAAPLVPSTTTAAGSAMFELTLSSFDLQDELGMPVRVEAPATYLRVVVHIPGGGLSSTCDALMRDGPSFVPVRDDDGRIADERGFIYDPTSGWFWNEQALVTGDWAVRLVITPSAPPGTDAGTITPPDGGTDASTLADASTGSADAGEATPAAGGCTCRAVQSAPSPRVVAGAIGLLLLFAVRRRAPRERRRGEA